MPSSSVAAFMATGGSPLDALPDALLCRIIFEAVRRDWGWFPPCSRISLLESNLTTADDFSDVQPDELVKLRAVCRRFRRIIDDGSLWGRLALWEPNDAAATALAALPQKARAAVRRMVVSGGSITFSGFLQLAATFRDQLEDFSLSLCGEDAAQLPYAAIAAVQHMQRLRSLFVSFDVARVSPAALDSAPEIASSLSAISLLPNLQVLELDLTIPAPVQVLRALSSGQLASSLRALQFCAELNGRDSPAEVFAAAAKFTSLEKLGISFRDQISSQLISYPDISDEQSLRPLCNLTQMRELSVFCCLGWFGFISEMPRLQSLVAVTSSLVETDVQPIFSCTTLRALSFDFRPPSADHGPAAAVASALASFPHFEILNLVLPSFVFEALGNVPLAPWSRLERLVVGVHMGPFAFIPPSFLQRLASDVPSLRELAVNSRLPVAACQPNGAFGIAAVSALNRLSYLLVSSGAAEHMSGAERQLLVASLMDVRVEFGDAEGADEGVG
eukprot:tig00000760_g3932.t1